LQEASKNLGANTSAENSVGPKWRLN
ncbi:hypothetical protein A2U01_0035112, partial [Trifolium medium]|nr:hypothetical protein [Trifolium medium]